MIVVAGRRRTELAPFLKTKKRCRFDASADLASTLWMLAAIAKIKLTSWQASRYGKQAVVLDSNPIGRSRERLTGTENS